MRDVLSYLTVLLGLFVGLTACSSGKSPALPTLELSEVLTPADSLALVLLEGDEASTTDTLHLGGKPLREPYRPDTLRYRKAWVVTEAGRQFYLFELSGGQWVRQHALDSLSAELRERTLRAEELPLREPYFVGLDARGREHIIERPERGKQYLVAFSDASLMTLSRAEADSLERSLRPDRAEWIFLMLSSSDSTARNRLRRDSLSGLVFSDSLGLVTRLRESYGIERVGEVRLFRLDSSAYHEAIPLR